MRARVALALVTLAAAPAVAQAQVDLSGQWDWVNRTNAGEEFRAVATIDAANGAFTWDWRDDYCGSGTHTDTTLELTGTSPCGAQPPQHRAFVQGQISSDGATLTGTWSQESGPPDYATQISGTFVAQRLSPPDPVLGQAVNVSVVRGTVRVREPGGGFRRLRDDEQIPVGSVVDTDRGTVRLTSAANARGETQTADFRDGVFKIRQGKGRRPFTNLALQGRLENCGASAGAHIARHRRGRRLWGSGRGRFRTIGNRASAGVRGTRWLVADRCDGSTLVRVTQGRVTVRDFVRARTLVLSAGQRYVARPRR